MLSIGKGNFHENKRSVKQDVPLIIAASVLSSLFAVLVVIGFQWQNI